MARTAPSGTRGVGCGEEPRTRGASAPAQCQSSSFRQADGDVDFTRRPAVLARLTLPVQRPRLPFERPYDLVRDPAAVVVTRLRRHALAVQQACVHLPRIY